jgi:Type I phosphodiesterase / nucleotide pyrophosphatase
MSKVVTVLASGYLLVCGLFAADSEATAEQAAIAAPPAAADESTLHTQAARLQDSRSLHAGTSIRALERPDVDHVVFISLDGFNAHAVTTLGPAGAPTFHRMMNEGASTLNARTTVERTTTLPNHSSMVSGRAITKTRGHGVTFNTDDGSTIHDSADEYVASIFDVVHDNGGSTGMYVGKAKFDFLDRSWNATNGAPDVTGADNGRDKIDVYEVADGSTTVASLLSQLTSPTPKTLSFVHFADPDNAGHASGFMSPAYLDAVTALDGYLARILDAVADDPDLVANTVVIVTTDHGGISGSFGHSARTDAANYTVPLFAWGVGVAAGVDLYAINGDRADPGTTQPSYSAPVPPIRIGEAANLIAELLGLDPVPGATFNSDQSLDLAPPQRLSLFRRPLPR